MPSVYHSLCPRHYPVAHGVSESGDTQLISPLSDLSFGLLPREIAINEHLYPLHKSLGEPKGAESPRPVSAQSRAESPDEESRGQ